MNGPLYLRLLAGTALLVPLLSVGTLAQDARIRGGSTDSIENPAGFHATLSSQGFVDGTGAFFQVLGGNGRSCATCHLPQEAWSITPATLQSLFNATSGTAPVFNPLDADNPERDFSTVAARRAAYSMLLRRGVFRRGGALRAEREWDLIAVDDPHGFANLTRLVHWRRSMPTMNFGVGSATVQWDGGRSVGSDQRAGLENQARGAVTGALQGSPAAPEVIAAIVDFQNSLSTAQLMTPGSGVLYADGARGGPYSVARTTKAAGRFDLFDAWAGHVNPARAQIARGQELFNTPNRGGRSCVGCHDSVNNGTSFSNTLFDVRTASAEARTPDLPLYTFRNRATGETRQLTDAGAGNVTGLWKDLGRFKTPTLRALAARAPYFHNGSATTLADVVRHYETHLGFVYTDEERADLVAFLNAL